MMLQLYCGQFRFFRNLTLTTVRFFQFQAKCRCSLRLGLRFFSFVYWDCLRNGLLNDIQLVTDLVSKNWVLGTQNRGFESIVQIHVSLFLPGRNTAPLFPFLLREVFFKKGDLEIFLYKVNTSLKRKGKRKAVLRPGKNRLRCI